VPGSPASAGANASNYGEYNKNYGLYGAELQAWSTTASTDDFPVTGCPTTFWRRWQHGATSGPRQAGPTVSKEKQELQLRASPIELNLAQSFYNAGDLDPAKGSNDAYGQSAKDTRASAMNGVK